MKSLSYSLAIFIVTFASTAQGRDQDQNWGGIKFTPMGAQMTVEDAAASGANAVTDPAPRAGYVPSLTLNHDGYCLAAVGETLTVTVDMANMAETVVGAQVFLAYDNEVLEFVSVTPGEAPFNEEVFNSVDQSAGTIDYAMGIPHGGVGTTEDRTLAVIQFTIVQEVCEIANLVMFRPHDPPTRLGDEFAGQIRPLLSALAPISVESTSCSCAQPPPETTLTLNNEEPCVTSVGETITVTVDVTGAEIQVCGGQFFLAYDNTVLDFVSIGIGEPPFIREIFVSVDEGAGEIDYSVGTVDGDPGSDADRTLAVIEFEILQEVCQIANLVMFRPHAPPTRLCAELGEGIVPQLYNLPQMSVDQPDCLCLTVPPAVPPAPHDTGKHRYVSINPSTNDAMEVAYRVDLVSMRRCSGQPSRACTVDEDCEASVPGTGTCIEHSDVGTAGPWWVQAPQQEPAGCLPGNVCGDDDWFARVSSDPYFDVWTLAMIHIGDCEIIPVATYEIRTCIPPGGVACSDPLTIGTIAQPFVGSGFRGNYGDVAGTAIGADFTPPDGVTNVTDVQAYILTTQNYGTANTPQAHPTWVDLHGLGEGELSCTTSGMPCTEDIDCPAGELCRMPPNGQPPNYILNVADLGLILKAFGGDTWTDDPGNLNPGECP